MEYKSYSCEETEKIAVLIAKDVSKEKVERTIKKANILRKEGKIVMISPRNSNAKFQKEKLANAGFTSFVEIFNDHGEL